MLNKKIALLTPEEFVANMPKAELHMHIEGSFEPELMFQIAKRNKIEIKVDGKAIETVDELKEAYNFNCLQDFLDIYYQGAGALQTQQDFYDMTMAYLLKAKEQNIVHTEIFFDPQTHTDRGIEFDTVIKGIHGALEDGQQKLGVSSRLILSFLRHLDEDSAFKTLESAKPYKEWITAVGLDSSEKGNPPEKFERVFKAAQEEGFLTVAHAGEEGPADYVWQALNLLNVSRVDHGNKALGDDFLVKTLRDKKMPLTVCPLSNLKLKGIGAIEEHPIKTMLNNGLVASVNSDDPAYFGGYVNENFNALIPAVNLSKEDVVTLAANSFKSSFIPDSKKSEYLEKLNEYAESYTF